MPDSLRAIAFGPGNDSWPGEVDRLRAMLGAPHTPTLLPAHFLKVTLARIGGHALRFDADGATIGAAFLFPRSLHGAVQEFTLRFHRVLPGLSISSEALCAAARRAIGDIELVFYDADAAHRYRASSRWVDGVRLGRPSAAEAQAIRTLQAQIWGSAPDLLYPADLHSPEFGSTRSFVARVDGRLAAFLFGFFKFGGSPLPDGWRRRVRGDWRIESQTMGVHPAYRGRGLATALKSAQAEVARRAGVDVVNWTADPLQWPNAVLNLGRLGAVAYEFLPDYYAFRNELNRVAASRVALTWLVASPRVRRSLGAPVGDSAPSLADVGARPVDFDAELGESELSEARLAVEIPRNWTALQAEEPDRALRWRHSTDRLLARILGPEPGRYMLTGVAQQAERRYLVAERITPSLLESLLAQ